MSFSSDAPLLSNQLPLSVDFPDDPKLLKETLSTNYKRTVDSMNTKVGGMFLKREQASYVQYFPTTVSANSSNSLDTRSGYRMTYDLVDLNGGPIAVGVTVIAIPTEQLIDGIVDPTDFYGACTLSGPRYRGIPSMEIDAEFNNTVPAAQTIEITNNSGSALDQAYLVFEYTKE